jgi:hypothetical protein
MGPWLFKVIGEYWALVCRGRRYRWTMLPERCCRNSSRAAATSHSQLRLCAKAGTVSLRAPRLNGLADEPRPRAPRPITDANKSGSAPHPHLRVSSAAGHSLPDPHDGGGHRLVAVGSEPRLAEFNS